MTVDVKSHTQLYQDVSLQDDTKDREPTGIHEDFTAAFFPTIRVSGDVLVSQVSHTLYEVRKPSVFLGERRGTVSLHYIRPPTIFPLGTIPPWGRSK